MSSQKYQQATKYLCGNNVFPEEKQKDTQG